MQSDAYTTSMNDTVMLRWVDGTWRVIVYYVLDNVEELRYASVDYYAARRTFYRVCDSVECR